MNSDKSIAQCIDYTVLRPDLTNQHIFAHCQEAIKHRFGVVCVPPYYVSYAKSLLKDTQTSLCTVVSFPFGYNGINAKMEEIKKALIQGCDEIDFVVNISAIKNGDWKTVESEIDSLSTIAHMKDNTIKAISDTHLLTPEEIEMLSHRIIQYDIDYMITSVGLQDPEIELETVRRVKSILGSKSKVKAAGDIQTKEQALQLFEAGADRIGTSHGIQIVS
jgi:deoxyribose-phosphate aldolase